MTTPAERHQRAGIAEAAIRRGDELACRIDPIDCRENIAVLLQRNVAKFASKSIVVEKKEGIFDATSWGRFGVDVVSFGSYLRRRGVRAGDRVVVLSRNRREMLTTEFALMCIGAIHVPIFAAYPSEQVRKLIEHAGARVAVVSDQTQYEKIAYGDRIEWVISYDEIDPRRAHTERCTTFAAALEEDSFDSMEDPTCRDFLQTAMTIDPNSPALMMYTSGTSGNQKGVLLSHDNILSQQRAIARLWKVDETDRFLSYLPWHHSFGGIFEKYIALYSGAALYIDDSYGKDFSKVLENWKLVRPTIYFSVPKIHQDLVNHVQHCPEDESAVFHDGFRFVFTAAAPLPAHVSDFYASKGIPVIEGWGLTETAPCCTLTDMARERSIAGMVGHPIPGVRLKLAPDGEILVKGPNVMIGYHADEEATASALPGDGWFHTGDLGEFVGKGLKLVTRKDRVFKMLNAEKVVPTIIENRLAGMDPYIQHVIVIGSGESKLAALVFPNFAAIAKEFGTNREAAEEKVKASLRRTFERFNEQHAVKYERIQAFAVVSKELTIEEEELTPSMKVRVNNVLDDAEGYIDAVYRPREECDCLFMKKVMRLLPDSTKCFRGKDLTLDRCHECGPFILGEHKSSRSNRREV